MTGTVGTKLRNLTKKQFKYILIFGILILVLLIASISYAVYASRIAGWQQDIYIQSFSFTLNGNNIGTDNKGTINNENGTLNLIAKGQEADFNLAVEARGYATGKFNIPYTINLTLDSTQNNDLAKAVEVYQFTDGEYVFVSMLDEFLSTDSVTLTNGTTVTGKQINGKTGINGVKSLKYKLVYSLGAGEFYEEKGFSIYAEAYYTKPEYTNTEYYVYTANDIKEAAYSDTDNVTVVLLNDIELSENITFSRKVGFDLNGHTLSTGSYSIRIDYADTYTQNDIPYFLKIDDSSGMGTVTGSGIIINSPNDILLVSDAYKDKSFILISSFSQDSFATHAQLQLSALCEKPIKGTTTSIDFTKGLKKYITGPTALAVTDTDVISSVSGGVCTININLLGVNSFTNVYYIQFTSYTTTISGELTILGNNAYSVANRIIANIPQVIHSSVFLPVYDSEAKANITWITTNPDMLTTDGVFLQNGYESFPDWTNQMLELGVIVEVNGERYAAAFTREICILTAEERTRLLYDYASMTLDLDDPNTAVKENIINVTDHISNVDNIRQKLGYNDVRIVVDNATETTDNPNYTQKTESKWFVDYYGSYSGKISVRCNYI